MIKSKTALIAAMKARPGCRICGHMGARPAAPWRYELQAADGALVDRVSSVAVDAMHKADSLYTVHSSWQYGVYRLRARVRNA
jgi:hypothetical protein